MTRNATKNPADMTKREAERFFRPGDLVTFQRGMYGRYTGRVERIAMARGSTLTGAGYGELFVVVDFVQKQGKRTTYRAQIQTVEHVRRAAPVPAPVPAPAEETVDAKVKSLFAKCSELLDESKAAAAAGDSHARRALRAEAVRACNAAQDLLFAKRDAERATLPLF
jgi:hypothetical protein